MHACNSYTFDSVFPPLARSLNMPWYVTRQDEYVCKATAMQTYSPPPARTARRLACFVMYRCVTEAAWLPWEI